MIRIEVPFRDVFVVPRDADLGGEVRRVIAERIAPFVFEPKRHQDLLSHMLIRSCEFDVERQVFVCLIE